MLNRYKNMKIASKLITGFLIVAILAAIIGVIGIVNISSLGKADNKLYTNNTLGLNDIGNASVYYQRVRFNIMKSIAAAGTDASKESLDKIPSYIEKTEQYLESYKASIIDEEDQALYDAMREKWDVYLTYLNNAMDMENAGKMDEAKDFVLSEDMQTAANELQTSLDDIFTYNTTAAHDTNENNTRLVQTSMIIMIGVAAAGIIIALILGGSVSRMISKPLQVMADDARKLALGDVDIAASSAEITKDEIGDLMTAFVKMAEGRKNQVHEMERLASGDLTVELQMKSEKDVLNKSLIDLINNLNDVVTSIQSSADQVSSGSSLVANSSMALSQGATEQASSVQQLTASLQEIASQTTMSASNAQSANQLARLAKQDAEEGNERMKGMLHAMEAINASSTSISKIIKVIDDIAFQTNILALNAAVEAARAGQHGKGFAVVAEEVRTLAARSAQAAKETTDLIEGSIQKVEDGTKIATDTATALGKIVGEVAKAADLVQDIANASNEQASAIEQINQGVLQVSQVVQNNAATSEESAAASEELSSQAAQLKETVSIFKTKHDSRYGGGFAADTPRLSERKPQPSKSTTRPMAGTAKPKISLSDNNFGKY